MIDPVAYDDLLTFAVIEVRMHDIEPWAEMLHALHVTGKISREEALWLVKLYNAYDSLGSAWAMFRRWPTIEDWRRDPDYFIAADFPCTQERRNLRGGKVLQHLASYAEAIWAGDGSHHGWLKMGLTGNMHRDFANLTERMRRVWGVGRQTAFEWAEFAQKVVALPVDAADAQLWESSGPRKSIERIYGLENPTPTLLEHFATDLRRRLTTDGCYLSVVDFETVICDFNVMRDGRYYPGRHLAALREEIAEQPRLLDQRVLLDAFNSFVPTQWQGIEPGIKKALLPVYKHTGKIVTEP